ncbi:FIVAR domain-containing protein [Pseudolactococcus raffinolactis]|uniref:FIVAR domain-containing protein n=7 Tax=Pseudolactococcus raffinolactis TaxID=1366 RepID=UPI0013D56522|nr:FIVAR domain-containing protein [Lactococcus raffinolactis]
MNLMEFKAELEQLEIPIQYQAFSVGQAPELPYLIFYENDSDNVFADNHNYYDVLNVSCELYADEKDIELETKLQKLLYDLEIEYNSTETFIDSENMYMKSYDVVITFDSLADVKEKEVDKSNLKSLIDYVETLKSDAYEVDGFSKLETVLAYAKAVLIDMETVQDEVDEIEIELLNALNGLIVLKIDKTQLKAQIDYVKTLSAVEYTTESWGVLKIALANAEAVYGNDNATQSNVNDVLNKLFESYQNLQKPTGGFEKGVNLYAPLSWQAQGLYGGLDYSTGEVNDHTFYIHSDFIKIPDKSPSVSMQTKGSDSIYIFIYDENKMFMKNEYVYGDVIRTFEILRKAKYIRMYTYEQTPSSVLINKTKIEFGELTDWTIAKEDEQYMQLQLI